jgi:hypothetical protein
MHRSAVKKKLANIFNCIFESSKSAKIAEFFTEYGLCELYDFALTLRALSVPAPPTAFTSC